MPFPSRFPRSILLASPKHSISVLFSAGSAVPLSVDVKEVALARNPAPELAVKMLLGPQTEDERVLCTRGHSLFPPSLQVVLSPTLQMVIPLMSPVTVQVKVKVSPGHVGGAAVNCPVTSPESYTHYNKLFQVQIVGARHILTLLKLLA